MCIICQSPLWAVGRRDIFSIFTLVQIEIISVIRCCVGFFCFSSIKTGGGVDVTVIFCEPLFIDDSMIECVSWIILWFFVRSLRPRRRFPGWRCRIITSPFAAVRSGSASSLCVAVGQVPNHEFFPVRFSSRFSSWIGWW